MLPKEIMLRTGTRTKANASDVAHSHALFSYLLHKKLLNPGSLSLLLKVLGHLADCPPVPGSRARHEAPRFPTTGAMALASRTLSWHSSSLPSPCIRRPLETHQEAAVDRGLRRLLPDAEV